MKLPKHFFDNLSAERYRAYLKLLPDMHNERVQQYMMLSFTLAALSFFGIFAINPTLTTVVDLKKQIEDDKYIVLQLNTKLANISTLINKYDLLAADLPYVYAAFPQSPQVSPFLGKVYALTQRDNLSVRLLHAYQVELSPPAKAPLGSSSFVFSLEAVGTYDNMIQFALDLVHLDRVVTVELFSVSKDAKQEELTLNLRGREYFMKE
jgi:Tfp pilus assembly protein PilO